MTYPYVAVLYEHQPQQQEQLKDEKESDKDRTFTAVRYNLFGGQASETFAAMRDERFADIAAETGAFGLARQLEVQFARLLPAAPPTTPAAAPAAKD